MNSPLIQAITGLIDASWTMLTAVKFPGTEIPIAMILVGAFVAWFGIRIFAFILRMNVNVGDTAEKADRFANPQKFKKGRGI